MANLFNVQYKTREDFEKAFFKLKQKHLRFLKRICIVYFVFIFPFVFYMYFDQVRDLAVSSNVEVFDFVWIAIQLICIYVNWRFGFEHFRRYRALKNDLILEAL